MNIVIATIKSWNIDRAVALANADQGTHQIRILTTPEALTLEALEEFCPDFVVFPHWSWIIPPEIYNRYFCIVFHMTDLPYGRGGSPLQNLIVRKHRATMISAIKVQGGLDNGPILIKEPLNLDGSADEIFRRMADIVFSSMIPRILSGEWRTEPQHGEAVYFRRRTPEESRITGYEELEDLFDHIRMLDGEGYPAAFIEYGDLRIEFTKAQMVDGKLNAEVSIRRRQ